MVVYQHENGRWYYRFKIRGKSFHRAIPEATDERSARKAETITKAELLQGKFNLVDSRGEMLFTKLVDVYIDYTKANNASYKTCIGKAEKFRSYFKNKKLCDITPVMIEQYRIKRKCEHKDQKNEKPIANTTINREVEILRKMFNIAIDNEWCDKNPASSKVVKKLKEENILERYLSVEEEASLFAQCVGEHAYMKPILICALNTGMRKGEILGLKWNCVNLKEQFMTLLHTKSGKMRKIIINSQLMPILEELKEARCCEYVFSNPATQNRYFDLKRSFDSICKKANIENLRFHDLRHTAGTRMVAARIDLVVVQNILGHADIKTTMRYTHPVNEIKLLAFEALAKYSDEASQIVIKKTDVYAD